MLLVSKGLGMRGWFSISATEEAEAWLGDARIGSCLLEAESPLGCFAVAKESVV